MTFYGGGAELNAVQDVSLQVFAGETLGLVGESGCGKTTLARAVLGLQPLSGGEILWKGKPMSDYSGPLAERIGMVWQDPYASLDPRWTVTKSLTEPLKLTKRTADLHQLLQSVGLNETFADRFPHQMSGGQRQRVAIGRAIGVKPNLIICDEPTAALDLSIRAQILNLLKDIQSDIGTSYFYISHDLTTVQFLADRVAVMYLGQIVEIGSTAEVFESPRHPYTRALLDSAPTLETLGKLPDPLPGEIPDPREKIQGCKFAGRCPFVTDRCLTEAPKDTVENSRHYKCHNPLMEVAGTSAQK